MDGGHHIGIERDDSVADVSVDAGEFVYVPGRTLYLMPFEDAEEEAAWDSVVEARNR